MLRCVVSPFRKRDGQGRSVRGTKRWAPAMQMQEQEGGETLLLQTSTLRRKQGRIRGGEQPCRAKRRCPGRATTRTRSSVRSLVDSRASRPQIHILMTLLATTVDAVSNSKTGHKRPTVPIFLPKPAPLEKVKRNTRSGQ